MLKVAKSYNASFGAIKLSKDLKAQLPIWYHLNASKRLRRLDNTLLSKCLRQHHNIIHVADIMLLSQHDFIPMNGESDDTQCNCTSCALATASGCRHPLKCIDAARRILYALDYKWDPYADSPNDGLSLTQHRKDSNAEALDNDGEVVFNPSVTERGGIAETFRLFVKSTNLANPPAVRKKHGIQVTREMITMY
ncbi:uncharacterized protein C8Q71DRAFT_677175, partial [Rhodofomes roseus]